MLQHVRLVCVLVQVQAAERDEVPSAAGVNGQRLHAKIVIRIRAMDIKNFSFDLGRWSAPETQRGNHGIHRIHGSIIVEKI